VGEGGGSTKGMDAPTTCQARSIVVVLDASGSMYPDRRETVDALNALLMGEVRQQALPPQTRLFIYTFNTRHSQLTDPSGMLLSKFEGISYADYECKVGGETALYDVLDELIEVHTEATFVIISDGRDNASTRVSEAEVQRTVAFARDYRGCAFKFVGEGLDAEHTGLSIGMAKGDMFLSNGQLASVLSSNDVSTALSQSMTVTSPDMMPPFLPAARKRRKKKKEEESAAGFTDSQNIDL